jgi:hypothetical protein
MMPMRGAAARGDVWLSLLARAISQDRGALVDVQPLLLLEEVELAPDAQAARRHLEISRACDLDAIDRAIDGSRRFDVVLDAFDADPDRGEARERDAVQANSP